MQENMYNILTSRSKKWWANHCNQPRMSAMPPISQHLRRDIPQSLGPSQVITDHRRSSQQQWWQQAGEPLINVRHSEKTSSLLDLVYHTNTINFRLINLLELRTTWVRYKLCMSAASKSMELFQPYSYSANVRLISFLLILNKVR